MIARWFPNAQHGQKHFLHLIQCWYLGYTAQIVLQNFLIFRKNLIKKSKKALGFFFGNLLSKGLVYYEDIFVEKSVCCFFIYLPTVIVFCLHYFGSCRKRKNKSVSIFFYPSYLWIFSKNSHKTAFKNKQTTGMNEHK